MLYVENGTLFFIFQSGAAAVFSVLALMLRSVCFSLLTEKTIEGLALLAARETSQETGNQNPVC